MENLDVHNMDYDQRRKYDITITIDACNVAECANRLAHDLNTDRIPYSLGMSGQITPEQLASLLARFLPEYLQCKVEDDLLDVSNLMHEVDQDNFFSSKFDAMLKSTAGLAHAQYHAEATQEDWRFTGPGWLIAEDVLAVSYRDPEPPVTTVFYPFLGTFPDEHTARFQAHRWNRAYAACKAHMQRLHGK